MVQNGVRFTHPVEANADKMGRISEVSLTSSFANVANYQANRNTALLPPIQGEGRRGWCRPEIPTNHRPRAAKCV